MYRVDDELAAEQVGHLPAHALAAYAELRVLLETDPWSGRAYHGRDQAMGMRSRAFGSSGFVVFAIRDAERVVLILQVIWAG